MIPYIQKEKNVTFVLDGNVYLVDSNNKKYEKLLFFLREENWEEIENILLTPTKLETYSNGNLELKDNCIFYKGKVLHNYLIDKIISFLHLEEEVTYLLNFLEKLMQNPSNRAVTDLFKFLEAGKLPIAKDGDFYAYKAVTDTYMDKHTGSIDNSIGSTVKMERNEVEDNPDISCSSGLHAGTLGYVNSFAGYYDKKIVVKINPMDIVSVPKVECQKLRCCRYEVVSDFKEKLPETIYVHDLVETNDMSTN